MNQQHTPGPWEHVGAWIQTADNKKTPIAIFDFHAATEGNARLISAAPDLLDALQMCIKELGWSSYTDEELTEGRYGIAEVLIPARAAIAKATGKTQ